MANGLYLGGNVSGAYCGGDVSAIYNGSTKVWSSDSDTILLSYYTNIKDGSDFPLIGESYSLYGTYNTIKETFSIGNVNTISFTNSSIMTLGEYFGDANYFSCFTKSTSGQNWVRCRNINFLFRLNDTNRVVVLNKDYSSYKVQSSKLRLFTKDSNATYFDFYSKFTGSAVFLTFQFDNDNAYVYYDGELLLIFYGFNAENNIRIGTIPGTMEITEILAKKSLRFDLNGFDVPTSPYYLKILNA